MKFTKGLLVIAIAAFAFAGCKKDDDDKTPSQTKKEMLTSGSWYLKDFVVNDTSYYDVFFDDCDKDDFQTFKTNGMVTMDEGATKCDPTDPQTEDVLWMLSTDEKTITIDGDPAELTTINQTDLVMTMKEGTDKIVLKMKKK